SRTTGLAIRKTSTAISAIHSTMLGSRKAIRRPSPPRPTGVASVSAPPLIAAAVRSYPERVAPLLDHLGHAAEDFLDRRADGLHILGRHDAVARRNLGPHRFGETVDLNLRGFGAEQIFHEQPGGVRMLHALHDAGWRDDQHRAVAR